MVTNYSLEEAVDLWGSTAGGPYDAMVLDFIESRAQALAADLPNPVSADAWRQRAETLRAPLRRSLGLSTLPERTPLNDRIVGQIERDGYRIEKLVYEPRPGFPTPAHLYVPQALDSPAPAVLYAMGHYMENAKLDPEVQLCCANLARLGFVVLVYDAIGQGERLGDWLDHGHLEPLLVGLCQEALMVWESMRGVDYLVSRPEVDAGRIGMTGSSGGGLNTFYTAAVEGRIQVSIPVCFVTTFRMMMSSERDRNWEDGMDLCNQVPGVMTYAEMWDILGLFAPKPLRIITAIRDDLFPVEGTRRVYRRLQQIYRLLGAEDHVDLLAVDSPHAYNQEMRQSAYGWFARWLKQEGDGDPIRERACELLPLSHPASDGRPRRQGQPPVHSPGLCLPPGQGAKPGPAITGLTQELAEALGAQRNQPDAVAAWKLQRRALLARMPAVIGSWPQSKLRAKARIYNRVQSGSLIAERVVYESEPGIHVPGLFLMPNQWETSVPVVLYVDEWGKRAGLGNGFFSALLSAGFAVLAIDVRGWGETGASDFEAATNALMTDRPLFGQRLWDLLEAIRRLAGGGYVSGRIDRTRIGCVGQGTGALLALYAAAMDEQVMATVMWRSPLSYRALIEERPDFPPSVFLFDVLRHFDLPDLMAVLAPRPLLLESPVDGRRRPLAQADLTIQCTWPQAIYSTLEASGEPFQAHTGAATGDETGRIVDWLKMHL